MNTLLEKAEEYQVFIEKVLEELNRRIGKNISIRKMTANKVNGIKKEGVVIFYEQANTSPVIYFEDFYAAYLNGMDVESIVSEIIDIYQKASTKTNNYAEFTDYNMIIDKIFFKVLNTKYNKEILKDIPHDEVMNLSIVYFVMKEESEEIGTMLITKEHLLRWDVTQEMIKENAFENAERQLPAILSTMEDAIFSPHQHSNLLKQEDSTQKSNMYVLTNTNKNFGAGCILYQGVLEEVGKVLGEDYYILPSSMHETIIVPISCSFEVSEMNNMVRKVNESVVSREEILGEHCYRYSISGKRIY